MIKLLSKFVECEADNSLSYCRVIETARKYNDGKSFPINQVVTSSLPINIYAEDRTKLGGFYVSNYDFIFRWLIRGDTLCKVCIPEKEKVYKTISNNGIFIANKIILTEPKKVDDDFATQLYLKSKLPEISYFKALTACSIRGYINTAFKVINDKVNKQNVEIVLKEFEDFIQRRNNENCFIDEKSEKNIDIVREKLLDIKNS